MEYCHGCTWLSSKRRWQDPLGGSALMTNAKCCSRSCKRVSRHFALLGTELLADATQAVQYDQNKLPFKRSAGLLPTGAYV